MAKNKQNEIIFHTTELKYEIQGGTKFPYIEKKNLKIAFIYIIR